MIALVGMKRNIITLFAEGKRQIKQVHTPVCFCRFSSLVNWDRISVNVTQITGLSSVSGSAESAGGSCCLHSYRHLLSCAPRGAGGFDFHCLLFC